MSRYEAPIAARRPVEVRNMARQDARILAPRQTFDNETDQSDYDMEYDQWAWRSILINLSARDNTTYRRVAAQRLEGWRAFQSDRPMGTNPYDRDSAEWAAWMAGWTDGRQENS
jgi:hypothetical protein